MKLLRMQMIEEKVAIKDRCKDNAKQFEAIRILKEIDQKKQPIRVNNEAGERIMNDQEAAEYVRSYFVTQFSDVSKPSLEAHPPGTRWDLAEPIKASEVQRAVKKLRNRTSCCRLRWVMCGDVKEWTT